MSKIKRNNPGNIRPSERYKWQGEITRPKQPFCEFSSIEMGCRAMLMLLRAYITRPNLNTLSGIIQRWAPPTDGNNTRAYINTVASLSGISAYAEISKDDKDVLLRLAKAMTIVEHGRDKGILLDSVWETAWQLLD